MATGPHRQVCPRGTRDIGHLLIISREDGAVRLCLLVILSPGSLLGCGPKDVSMDATKLRDFASGYTEAWCSQDPTLVAAFYAEHGSLTINQGSPAVGRRAITAAAQGFMTAFPDLVVRMDRVEVAGTRVIYRWTLTGTNTGPAGTGRPVHISGYEEWTIGADGLIAASLGHFDEADYDRQLQSPFGLPPSGAA